MDGVYRHPSGRWHSNHIFLFEHLCQLPRYDIFSEVLLYARHQNCILADKLDTQDILFPETHTKDVLLLVCKMFLQKKKSIDNLEADYSQSKSEEKLKRYMLVINMYSSGYSIKDIMTKTGYRGKSNIYRILKMYDVDVYYPQKIRKTTSSSTH